MSALQDCRYQQERLLTALGIADGDVAAAVARVEELWAYLRDARDVQRYHCDHAGIGLPGCVVCDPRPQTLLAARPAVTTIAQAVNGLIEWGGPTSGGTNG